ncbi:MAG: DNA recombination protein RmuC [Thermodesulfobacteriota bacterium]|nr:DNA recombination protein RmuC [Thermodesulfobacteriota bacterium]
MEWFYVMAGLCTGLATLVAVQRMRMAKLRKEITAQQGDLERQKGVSDDLRSRLAQAEILAAQGKQHAQDLIEMQGEVRREMKLEFHELASRVFDETTRHLKDSSRADLETILSPLREQINTFRKRVEDVYDNESRDRAVLFSQIDTLKELNNHIQQEAINLTNALKGDSKIRGDWGEIVLERVLEQSGLRQGIEFETQVSLKDENNRRFQPDVIIRLPRARDIIVDSKLSLNAFERYFSCDNDKERQDAMRDHIHAIRTHIKELSHKGYERLDHINSLDFVIMFIPLEPAFISAMQADDSLFNDAFKKHIVLTSPSTLLPVLKTIENMWRYEYQDRNALKIAQTAGALYDQFVLFVEALEDISKHLGRAQDAYATAHRRLVSGRANLVSRTQGLKDMGAQTKKKLPDHLVPDSLVPDSLVKDTGEDQGI